MPIIKSFSLPSRIRGANISDIVRDMKELHEQLSSIEQSEFETMREQLGKVASRLVDAELLKHTDKAIKLLVSCCLANILRLFAPDAPYQPTQLRDIFALMVQQLKLLADDKNVYQNYLYYLVESLATVKSIVLLLDIDDGDGERDRLLQQLFGLVFDLCPLPNITRTVKCYLLEMLQTLIDESDTIPSELIRMLLVKCGDIRQDTKAFAGDLARVCADKLQPGIGLYFNEHILHYASSDVKDGRKMDIIRQLHAQITDIGKVAPEAISSVATQLEEEMQADDMELRIVAVSCVAQLLAAPTREEFGKLYPNLLCSWMNKMNDRQSLVRIHWIKTAVSMLPEAAISLTRQLQAALTEKLQDTDAKVREKTLVIIRKFIDEGAQRNAQLLGADLCKEIGDRCLDKNEDVRLHAIELICLIIRRLFSAEQPVSNLSASSLFSACINATFKLIYTNDRDFRLFYEYYIEHALLMPQETDSSLDHAKFLIVLYGQLNEESRRAFKKWLNDKALFVKYFHAYMRLSVRADDARLSPLIQHLSSLFRVPLDAQMCLKAMPESILLDKEVKEAFEAIVRPTTPIDKQRKIVKWISQRNFEETDARVKSYVTIYLARRASLLSINAEIITAILTLIASERGDVDQSGAAQKLVGELIAEFPSLGIQHSGVLEEAICDGATEQGQVEHLRSYSSLISACTDKITPSPTLLQTLWNFVDNGSRQQVKFAVRILLQLPEPKQQLLGKVQFITEKLKASKYPDIVRAWQILAEVQKNVTIVGWINSEDSLTLVKNLIAGLADEAKDSVTSLKLDDLGDDMETAAVLAIKCLRNRVVALRSVDKNEELAQLRISAPLLVEWLSIPDRSILVKFTIAKVLITLVPRPTATTVIENLLPLVTFWMDSPLLVKNRLATMVIRKYQLGNIGLIYLSLLVMSNNLNEHRGPLKDSIINLRKNDRFVDPLLPLDESASEINSRGLYRYEDWTIITLIIAALHPQFDVLDEVLVTRYAELVDFLADVVASEVTISYLFDAVVQLKRFGFIEKYAGRVKNLYVLSELMQNALRNRATSHKWMLQTVKKPITISDELLQELSSVEDVNKNMQRSFLVRMTKEKRKSDEQSKLSHKKKPPASEHEEHGGSDAENAMDVDSNTNSISSSSNVTPSKRPTVRRSTRSKTSAK